VKKRFSHAGQTDRRTAVKRRSDRSLVGARCPTSGVVSCHRQLCSVCCVWRRQIKHRMSNSRGRLFLHSNIAPPLSS